MKFEIPAVGVRRLYFAVVNPGSFFRAVSPIAQLLALLALIVCWKVPGARIAAAIALALTVAGDVMTFSRISFPATTSCS